MDYYQDVTLLPDAEVGLNFLWGKLYQRLHLSLATLLNTQGSVPIGLAFPQYQGKSLGRKLRLIGASQAQLANVDATSWLAGLQDYVHMTGSRPVPESVTTYVQYRRARTKTNKERLARRKARREGITQEQALEALGQFSDQNLKLPYVQMLSLSNDHRFRLFIEQRLNDQDNGEFREFSSYGLTQSGWLPYF